MSINRNLAKFAPSINTSGKAAVATITVTVSGGKYYIDGTQQQTVSLSKGITYRFDNSDSTNSGHPLAFSTTSNGTHGGGSAFTTGITTVGTAGSSGAYVEVTLEQDAADHLYYYCTNHSGMGGLVKTAPVGDANFASFASAFTFPTSDGSASQVLQTDGSGTISFGTPAASYGDSDVNTHLNLSSATSGQVLSYNGSDYAWISNAGYSDSDVNTHLNLSSASSGQILSYNGSDYAWVDDQSGSGGIASVLADTSPQLGGSLDVNGQSIVSASNGNIAITPDGSGKIILDGLSFPTSDGSANQVLKTDGSGQLGFVDQASGGGSFTAVASGTLANGDMVIVNSDGTVSAVNNPTASFGVGSESTFNSGNTDNRFALVYDTNENKVVAIYEDEGNSSYLTACVGTVSGTSITWGSESVIVSNAADTVSACFDSNSNKVVIIYRNIQAGDIKGYARVGTISGSSISFGSRALVFNGQTTYHDCEFDPDTNRVVFAASNADNSYRYMYNVGSVSGTSISLGSEAYLTSGSATYMSLCYDTTNNKMLTSYRDNANTRGVAHVGTVSSSGNSISWGSAVVFQNSRVDSPNNVYDSTNNRMVIGFTDYDASQDTYVIAGEVSGTSITFGTKAQVSDFYSNQIQLAHDTNAGKTGLITYSSDTSLYPLTTSSSDQSITVGTQNTVTSYTTENYSPSGTVFDPDTNQLLYGYKYSSSGRAIAITLPVVGSTNLTDENFVGVSDAAYADGATATIQTAGSVDDAQSGLTPGQTYFVQEAGGIALTASSPSVEAGTAVSSTELLISPDTNPATFGTSQVDAHLNVSTASSGQILSWNGSDYAWVAEQQGTSGLSPVNTHSQTISSDVTISATDNGFSVGPVSIANGITLTISSGARYAII